MKTRIKSRFGKNVIFQYGLQIAKYLFPFITLPYLTRVLGSDVYAVRAYILAAMMFMQVFLDYGFTSYFDKSFYSDSTSCWKLFYPFFCFFFFFIMRGDLLSSLAYTVGYAVIFIALYKIVKMLSCNTVHSKQRI